MSERWPPHRRLQQSAEFWCARRHSLRSRSRHDRVCSTAAERYPLGSVFRSSVTTSTCAYIHLKAAAMTARLRLLVLGAVASTACATASQSTSTVPRCEGQRMATVVNLSTNAVEAVAVRGGVETVLVLAAPGGASRPFRPPSPTDRDLAGGQGRGSFWYIRDAATGRRIAPRDPNVRSEWVCVEQESNEP